MASLESFVDQIDRLSRRMLRNFECCDRALVSCCELTAAQAYSLLTLADLGEVTMNEIAKEMRLHGTTMTRMVDSLVEKELAERRQDPDDRRVVIVALSRSGREMIDRLQVAKHTFLSAAFAELTDDERESILKAVQRLDAIADNLGATCCST